MVTWLEYEHVTWFEYEHVTWLEYQHLGPLQIKLLCFSCCVCKMIVKRFLVRFQTIYLLLC